MNGAAEHIEWVLDICAKYNISVLLDVHAVKGSQNGFDNSGQAQDLNWTSETNFTHWPIHSANWLGEFDIKTKKYLHTNYANIHWTLSQHKAILQRFGAHSAVAAYEPVNEPWEFNNLYVLQEFYRAVRPIIRRYAPQAWAVFHTSFRFEATLWRDLFADGDTYMTAFDTHRYMAWQNFDTVAQYCDFYEADALQADLLTDKYEVWNGEWALATDVCATYLGGF